MKTKKIILFSIMGWGLGHATRCIPMINSLLKDNEVILASNGRALTFLRQEYPKLRCIAFPDYAVMYPKKKNMLLLYLIIQIPSILTKLFREYKITQNIVNDYKINLIISDCRYGVFSKRIPTYFITHQLRFQLSSIFKLLEPFGALFNSFMFKFYSGIIIPDIISLVNLTGDLTHKGKISNHQKLHFLGAFCNVSKLDLAEDIDYFISISGPEIQRTLFEELILSQVSLLPGKKVVVLGKPDESSKKNQSNDNITIYNHVNRSKQNELLNRASFIICRSGYTSIMELIALRKTALLIPTPGQTEQEYLARHYNELGLFYVAQQKNLNLLNELKENNKKIKINKSFDIPINDVDAFRRILKV
jgi:uncharacterized protein (TIGR00661 family)